jgi:hypothetical protein
MFAVVGIDFHECLSEPPAQRWAVGRLFLSFSWGAVQVEASLTIFMSRLFLKTDSFKKYAFLYLNVKKDLFFSTKSLLCAPSSEGR